MTTNPQSQSKNEINHDYIRNNLIILKEKAKNYDKLYNDYNLLVNKCNELYQQKDEEYQNELLSLYGKNTLLKDEYRNLEIAFRNNLNEYNSKIENYLNIIQSKDHEINELNERLNNNMNNNSNLNMKNNNESQVYHLYDTIELLEDEKDKLEDRISNYISEIDDFKAEIGRKDLNIGLLNNEIKSLESVASVLEIKIDDLKTSNLNLISRNNYLESELNRIALDDEEDVSVSYEQECIIYDLKNKYNNLEKMYNKLKDAQLNSHIENSNQSTRIASLSWALESKDITLTNLDIEIKKNEAKIKELELFILQNDKEMNNLRISIENRENEIVELKSSNKKMEETISILGDWQIVNDNFS